MTLAGGWSTKPIVAGGPFWTWIALLTASSIALPAACSETLPTRERVKPENEATPADALAKRTLRIAEAAIPAGTFESAVLLGGVGKIRRLTGHSQEALALLDRAVEIRRKVLGADDPWFAASLAEKGLALRELGRDEEALAAFRQVLQIEDRRQDDDRVPLGLALTGLGQLLLGRGRAAEAIAPLERAVELHGLGAPPLERGEALFALTRALAGEPEQSERVVELCARARAAFVEAGADVRASEVEHWAPSTRGSPERAAPVP